MFAAFADRTFPTTYPLPAVVIVTEVTCALETTIVALAPLPVPPVITTFVYVPFVYKLPPTNVLKAVTPFNVYPHTLVVGAFK